MSQFDPIRPEDAEGKAAELLAAVKGAFGMVPNLFRYTAHSPATLDGLLAFSGALAGGKLSAKQRESIALAVAEVNGCDYCLSAHSTVAKLKGLNDAEVRSARTGHSPDADTDRLLAFSLDLVSAKGHVDPVKVKALLAAGVTPEQLLEVVANVAYNILTNYLNIVIGTEVDFPLVRAGQAV